jgi:hypothetical protein
MLKTPVLFSSSEAKKSCIFYATHLQQLLHLEKLVLVQNRTTLSATVFA